MSDQSNGLVRDELQTRTFNPNEHLIQLKTGQSSRDYLPVQWRLVWFRSAFPHGTIETEMLHLDLERDTEEEAYAWNSEKRRSEKIVKHAKGFVIFKATVKDGMGGIATGTKSEKAASFPDFIEKSETGAIGRALAALGYGTQFAPELDEQHRIVDSPVDRHPAPTNGNGNGNGAFVAMRPNVVADNAGNGNGVQDAEHEATESATEKQVSSIRKLCERLGKSEPENVTTLSIVGARKLIEQLTAEYRKSQQSSKAS